MEHSIEFSPHDLLPIKDPRKYKLPREFFYKNVIKHLIPDIIRVTSNGTPIDLNKIKDLEQELTTVLEKNKELLATNTIIRKFIKNKNKSSLKSKIKDVKSSFVSINDVSEEAFKFNYSSTEHRTYVINAYLNSNNRYKEYILDK